ncbi:sulfotransferase [Roseomonas populi]|uniref:Tetratricopeptide repeat protein n=1 Tax=Roseomonas populi TaxID=3121582 RepID=A0ABT1WXJ5_9PROT|nr:sulfotransferase [Roseomonas pecuniae]MCR0980562.1 tetratricopeptide repeat protein [Roseomonas pecuniae]
MAPPVPDREGMAREAEAALLKGDHPRAAALFGRLAASQPGSPRWRVALARTALSAGRPEEALPEIEAAESRSPQPRPAWVLLRARALEALDRPTEARSAFQAALALDPANMGCRVAVSRHFRQAGQLEEALRVLEEPPAAEVERDPLAGPARASLLLDLRRGEEARAAFAASLAHAGTAAAVQRLFPMVGRLLGRGEPAGRAFRRLRQVLDATEREFATEGLRATLSARLRLAMGETDLFRAEVDALLRADPTHPLALPFRSAARGLSGTPEDGGVGKVFVIGLSKTATSSLDAALSRLGLGAAHWANPITGQLLALEDAALLDALSDIPVADMMEALASRYPLARFILSDRPRDDWHRSVVSHYQRHQGTPDLDALRRLCEHPDQVPFGREWCGLQQRIYTSHASFPAAYDAHQARVSALFADSPGRLLRFSVFEGHGWDRLCGFLGHPVPDTPFPHANAAPGR